MNKKKQKNIIKLFFSQAATKPKNVGPTDLSVGAPSSVENLCCKNEFPKRLVKY